MVDLQLNWPSADRRSLQGNADLDLDVTLQALAHMKLGDSVASRSSYSMPHFCNKIPRSTRISCRSFAILGSNLLRPRDSSWPEARKEGLHREPRVEIT